MWVDFIFIQLYVRPWCWHKAIAFQQLIKLKGCNMWAEKWSEDLKVMRFYLNELKYLFSWFFLSCHTLAFSIFVPRVLTHSHLFCFYCMDLAKVELPECIGSQSLHERGWRSAKNRERGRVFSGHWLVVPLPCSRGTFTSATQNGRHGERGPLWGLTEKPVVLGCRREPSVRMCRLSLSTLMIFRSLKWQVQQLVGEFKN